MPDTENTYIIGTTGAESARLIDQEHLLTEAMGGLFPTEIDISHVTTVLNLACGPGEWDRTVATEYPEMSIVGVDIDFDMINYAKALASVSFLENVTFEQINIKEPFDFPDASFDLVNGRLLFGLMDRETWPGLVVECLRVLKPGGIILLSEYEGSISNSIALQHILRCLYQALADQGRTFSVDQCSIGICHMLGKLLNDAGYTEVASKPFHLDSSYGTPQYLAGCRDMEMAFALVKPYLMQAGKIEEAEYGALLYQMQIDMRSEHFVNVSFGLQVWGYKP
jgi:2-polyprenyl-3-methyl-5-hydroxy-6-metoxy-1,4-benzoquinol methylase